MSKEVLEKQIKQELMQKDKEIIINLYLQMKFERDIYEEQFTELKAENELYKMNESFEKEKNENAFKLVDSLHQQLKEKDEEIEKLKNICNKIRNELNKFEYDCEITYSSIMEILDKTEKGEQ